MKLDLLISNAEILLGSGNNSSCNAVAVHNGKIIEVGREKEWDNYSFRNTIDVKGCPLIPGFYDAHTHFSSHSVLREHGIYLNSVRSCEELSESIRSFIQSHKLEPSEWITAWGWDETNWADPALPTLEMLDEWCPNNPALLIRVDGHSMLVNSLAFDEISKSAVDLEGQTPPVLYEIDVDRRLYLPSRDIIAEAFVKGAKWMNSFGITSIGEMNYSLRESSSMRTYFSIFQKVADRMSLRVTLYLDYLTIKRLAENGIQCGFGNEQMRVAGYKMYLDGSFGSSTAWISAPYDNSKCNGQSLMSDSALYEQLLWGIENGWQSAIHAIGNRAIQQYCDVLFRITNEREDALEIIRDLRLRLEHAEFLTIEALSKVKDNAIVCSMQPNFLQWQKAEGMYERRIGWRRTRLNPFSFIFKEDVPLAFGSDAMPVGPLLGIDFAVNHPIQEFKLEPLEALKCYTFYPAFAAKEESFKGTIEKGKVADLIILSDNPINVSPETIRDIKILKTIFNGEIVYS